MKNYASLLAFLLCVILTFSVLAQSDADFAKANQDYAQGNFKEAISGYETLVRSGQWSANLFYDLGNAYFRTDAFGHAILNYARALEMQLSWPERYLQFASINQFSIAAAVAFWVGVFCIVRLIFVRRPSAATIALSVFSVTVFAIALLAVYELDHGSNGSALAIVTGKDVQARLATADTANSILALPPGSEVKILSTRGDWLYAT